MNEEYSDQLSNIELSLWAFAFRNIADYSTVLVNEDRTLDEAPDDLPTYTNYELTEGWEVVSDGYTLQYACGGPVMHDSEYFGSALAERVINEPGIYALISAEWLSGDADYDLYDGFHNTLRTKGWLVVRRVEKENPPRLEI